jgi:serine/threonine protein kinase
VTQDIQSGPGDLAPGEQLAGYEIQERIGRGGMAVVYRALDLRLGRLVALKVLASHLGEDEAFRQRFMRESRAAAGVDHPHIIPVFEAGEAAGMLFIAMRYVAGGDVRTLIESRGRLSLERTGLIASQVASALDSAHAYGLVHRDVKPANILLGQASGSELDHVYLSDFGLSKHSLNPSTLTSTGQFLGTLDYVAPEQIQGHAVDGRADQYGLACAVVEMLTGAPPFRRDDSMALMWAQIEAAPPRLTERRPDLPAAVDQVIATAMAKSPDGRFRTCQDFASALFAAGNELWSGSPALTPPLSPAASLDPFLGSPLPATSLPETHLPASPFPATPFAATPFAATPRAATPHAPTPYAATPYAAGQYAAGQYAADETRADDARQTDPFRANPMPAATDRADVAADPLGDGAGRAQAFHADPLRDGGGRAEAFRADPLQDDAGRADPFRAAGLAASPAPQHSVPGPWAETPGDWFRGTTSDPAAAERTVGPGWAANGSSSADPVPGSIAPFRPAVDAAWPAGAPPGQRQSATPDTRPRRGPGPAAPSRHRTRNIVLAVVITAIGLCGVAGIAYKLSHRPHRSPPPQVTVTRTIPPGAQDPVLTVRQYFAAINHHRFMAAWRLSGAREPYATFRKGFVGTLYDSLTVLSTQGNVVTARLAATQTNGTVKTYQGTYTVTDGVITATNVRQVS